MADQKVIVTKSKLTSLANSVAAKSGLPVLMTIDEMKAAVDGIALPESEYYIWQDEDGYVHMTGNMPDITSSSNVLKLPGWLIKVGMIERMISVKNDELQLSNSIVQEVETIDEQD